MLTGIFRQPFSDTGLKSSTVSRSGGRKDPDRFGHQRRTRGAGGSATRERDRRTCPRNRDALGGCPTSRAINPSTSTPISRSRDGASVSRSASSHRRTSQPGENTHDRTRDRQGVRPRSAKRADEAAQCNIEDGLLERVGTPTGEASIDAWAVAEQVDGSKREAHRNPGRPPGALERPKVANEEPEQRRVRIAIGRQPGHTLDGPRPLPQSLEVLAQADEWRHDVEMIHPNELAPPGVEEDQLAQGEQLEGTSESRAHPTGCLGHTPQLAELERVEVDEPIALAELAAADHDRRCPVDGHDGRRATRSGGSRTPSAPCRRGASFGGPARSVPGRP